MDLIIFIFKIISAIIETSILLYFGSTIIKEKIGFLTPLVSGLLMLFESFIPTPWIGKLLYFLTVMICLKMVNKIYVINILKILGFGLTFLIALETVYVLLFQFILSLDLSLIGQEIRLLYLIPLRIIQILIILLVRRCSNQWEFYFGEKSKKKSNQLMKNQKTKKSNTGA